MNPLKDPGRHIIVTCKKKVDYQTFIKSMPNRPQLKCLYHKENNREYYVEMTLPDNATAVNLAKKLEILLWKQIDTGLIEITYRQL